MKSLKFSALALCAVLILSGCGTSTQNGGLIGGGAGAVLGGILGNVISKDGKGTAIGAAIGTAVGAGAGVLIGQKMDKAKAAAAAVQNAQVESITDANGLQAVKVTFDSGILFASGSSKLSSTAQQSLRKFATDVLLANTDMDVAIQGHTDNTGFKGVTSADENARRNQSLSLERAQSVSNYLNSLGVSYSQIKSVEGLGQTAPVASNNDAAGRQLNRRVEVYLYASQAMIDAANAGTLK